MAAPNLVILQLLHTQTNPAEFLRLCWDKLSSEQKKEIFHFLYISNQYKTFLAMLRTEINTDSPCIPWTHALMILTRLGKINEENLKSFIHSGSSTDQLGLFRINHPELIELWNKNKAQKLEQYETRKTELLKELEFAKQRGFRDQRSKILKELKKLFPQDEAVVQIMQTEKEFQAR
jgi:hypothetical protein